VLSVFHVTGSTDYLLHVAVADPESLRDLVLHNVVALPEVAHAETSLIFEHLRGEAPSPDLVGRANSGRGIASMLWPGVP